MAGVHFRIGVLGLAFSGLVLGVFGGSHLASRSAEDSEDVSDPVIAEPSRSRRAALTSATAELVSPSPGGARTGPPDRSPERDGAPADVDVPRAPTESGTSSAAVGVRHTVSGVNIDASALVEADPPAVVDEVVSGDDHVAQAELLRALTRLSGGEGRPAPWVLGVAETLSDSDSRSVTAAASGLAARLTRYADYRGSEVVEILSSTVSATGHTSRDRRTAALGLMRIAIRSGNRSAAREALASQLEPGSPLDGRLAVIDVLQRAQVSDVDYCAWRDDVLGETHRAAR